MNYTGIIKEDICNGPGIRTSLFVSGCNHECKGCFSQDSWDVNAGDIFTKETMNDIVNNISKHHITGLSLLGGDPLIPSNRFQIACLINKVKSANPEKDVWCWTGYLYEDLLEQAKKDNYLNFILKNIDVLVDGPFIEEKKDLTLKWRGSSNQRIIQLKDNNAIDITEL